MLDIESETSDVDSCFKQCKFQDTHQVILPSNTIWFNQYQDSLTFVLEIPPHTRTIRIRNKDKRITHKYKVQLPYTIMIMKVRIIAKTYRLLKLSLYANKEKIQNLSDMLYVSPLPNVNNYHDGQVCLGKIPRMAKTIQEFIDVFWQSPFSTDLGTPYCNDNSRLENHFKKWQDGIHPNLRPCITLEAALPQKNMNQNFSFKKHIVSFHLQEAQKVLRRKNGKI